MTLVMVVGDRDVGQPDVGPTAARRLAALGITRISLLADPSGIGVVLEGWAFDPAHITEAVRAIYPDGRDDRSGIRVFHLIQQVAVMPAATERRR